MAKAAKFFEKALEQKEYHAGACRMLARMEALMGNAERSVEVIERCQKIFPRSFVRRSASSD